MDPENSSGLVLGAGPSKRKVITISEVENGYIVQEQFYPRRQFIAGSVEVACSQASKVLASAAA